MSVLIDDMALPQNCDHCPLPREGWGLFDYYCPFDPARHQDDVSLTNVLFSDTRQPWCPLKEVEDDK